MLVLFSHHDCCILSLFFSGCIEEFLILLVADMEFCSEASVIKLLTSLMHGDMALNSVVSGLNPGHENKCNILKAGPYNLIC